MATNIPRVSNEKDHQKFFDAVKDAIDTLMGKKRNTKYTRALTVQDLEKFGVNLDEFLSCDKNNPYPL